MPPDYWVSYGDAFEQLISANEHLRPVVPAALLLIFGFLYMLFGSARDVWIVSRGVPLALIDGVVVRWLADIPFPISAVVGLIVFSSVVALNGAVMISFIEVLLKQEILSDQAG